MARQQYDTRPFEKHLEIYQDFSGGLNTIDTPDQMSDREVSNVSNLDLDERGALRRRHGMVVHHAALEQNPAQSYFRHYRSEFDFDEFVAYDGKLERNGELLAIEGLPDGFQKTKMIEAVQYKDKTYIATGTKLVEYDGEKAKVVEPYKPDGMNFLYVGPNGLLDKPNDYLTDRVDGQPFLDAVLMSKRYGKVNEKVTARTFAAIPPNMDLQFRYEWQKETDPADRWRTFKNWTEARTAELEPKEAGNIIIRVQMRDQADPSFSYVDADSEGNEITVTEDKVIGEYRIPKYTVKAANDPDDDEPDVSTIQTCTRIFLHWERLYMYGDEKNPTMLYISELRRPDYFPVTNCLEFENLRQEAITNVIKYRDFLVVFTPTSIQSLTGKSPADYQRFTLNSETGCVSPYGAAVVNNYVFFHSNQGIFLLKSFGIEEGKANIEKMDIPIDNIVNRDRDVCMYYHNNELHAVFPSREKRLRFENTLGVWMKDESPKLKFSRLYEYDAQLYGIDKDSSEVRRFDFNVFDDCGFVYEDILETKFYDFGQPYHTKKLKELQVTTAINSQDYIAMRVEVYVDNQQIIGDTSRLNNPAVRKDGTIVWEPIFTPNQGPLAEGFSYAIERLRLTGKGLKVKLRFVHKEPKQSRIIGFSLVFKMKKP